MRRLGALQVVIIAPCLVVLASCGERPQPAGPPPTISSPAPDRTILVIVARGQTLTQIVKLYRVPKEAIIAANDLKPPYSLKPGSLLTVPLAAQEEAKKKKPPPMPAATQSPPKQSQPKRSPGAPNPGDAIPLD